MGRSRGQRLPMKVQPDTRGGGWGAGGCMQKGKKRNPISCFASFRKKLLFFFVFSSKKAKATFSLNSVFLLPWKGKKKHATQNLIFHFLVDQRVMKSAKISFLDFLIENVHAPFGYATRWRPTWNRNEVAHFPFLVLYSSFRECPGYQATMNVLSSGCIFGWLLVHTAHEHPNCYKTHKWDSHTKYS